MAVAKTQRPVGPDLRAKSRPMRRNGVTTYETILSTAGEVLAEVGFERLTTNLVCERAGLTPPALYRYFPNKYALLSELARRLMAAQDEAVFAWLDAGLDEASNVEEAARNNLQLRKRLLAVTRDFPGGAWILRAIRAIPALQEVRLARGGARPPDRKPPRSVPGGEREAPAHGHAAVRTHDLCGRRDDGGRSRPRRGPGRRGAGLDGDALLPGLGRPTLSLGAAKGDCHGRGRISKIDFAILKIRDGGASCWPATPID
jgi:AcrR family transcriptional regulator